MIRVLQVGMVYTLGGGIQTFLMNYYNNIDKEKVQFDFINIYGDKFYYKNEIEQNGGVVYNLPNYYKHPIKFIKEMKNIINKNNYEIIHCNMNSAVMLYPLIAGKLSNAKVTICHAHNSSSDRGLLKKMLHGINKRLIPFFANAYFACSEKAGEWFFSKKIRDTKDYYIVNNAIDTSKFSSIAKTEKDSIRKEFNISKETTIVGNVGRFSPQKNHKFLIDIFNLYNKIHPNSALLLVGDGPLFNDIKEYAKNYNDLPVYFLGRRNDVNRLMQIFDVFVMTSLYEGLPLVGIEAQYSGIPCVFSDSISKEIKISQEVSFLSLKDQKEKWANTIKMQSTKKGNKVVNDSFDISNGARRIETIYKKLLKEKND